MLTEENNKPRLRAVLDTNTLISAVLTTQGIAGRIFLHAQEDDFKLITSDLLLAELHKVIHREKITRQIGAEQRDAFLELFQETAKTFSPGRKIHAIKTDVSDNRVLEAALAGKADYIVTGDKKHLLPLKKFRGIKIVSPRDFLAELLEYWLN